MKNFLLMCCLFIGLTTAVNAQTPSATANPTVKAKELQTQLSLTDKQTAKIAAIYTESAQKFDKIKASEHGDNDKMLVAIKPLRAETVAKIKATLTPAQKAKYTALINGPKGQGSTGWSDGWSATAAQ